MAKNTTIRPLDTQSEINAAKPTLARQQRTKDIAAELTGKAYGLTKDALTESLMATIRPVISILDGEEPEGFFSGAAAPSVTDQGLRIYLGQIIQTIANQLYGYSNATTGKTTQGQLAWLNEAEHRVNSPQFLLRAECDNLTPADLKAFHFFQLAEARVNMMTEHLQTFKTLYHEITNEDWKPYQPSPTPPTKTPASEIAKTLKEKFGTTHA